MTHEVSAVILSTLPVPAERQAPGCATLAHVSRFDSASGLLDARLAAIERVRTPWFFFWDDDDDLPADFASVLQDCLQAGSQQALVYTDEIIRTPAGERLRRSAPYSQQAHLQDMMLVHHLALCRTQAAQEAARLLPRGVYGVEPMLYWQMAKHGAVYVPRTGYIWNAEGGMHLRADVRIGMVQSMHWCGENP